MGGGGRSPGEGALGTKRDSATFGIGGMLRERMEHRPSPICYLSEAPFPASRRELTLTPSNPGERLRHLPLLPPIPPQPTATLSLPPASHALPDSPPL